MLNLPQTTQLGLLLALIMKNYATVNGIPWHWRTIHCIERYSRFCKSLGLMMACIGRKYSPLFKLIKRKVIVFDDVYIVFHFNTDLVLLCLYHKYQNSWDWILDCIVERVRLSVRAVGRSFKIICVHVSQIAVVVVGSNYCLHDETEPHTAPTVVNRITHCTDRYKQNHTLHRPL